MIKWNNRSELLVAGVLLGGLVLAWDVGVPVVTLLLIGLFVLCLLMMLGMHRSGDQHCGDTTSPPTQPTDQDIQASTRPYVN